MPGFSFKGSQVASSREIDTLRFLALPHGDDGIQIRGHKIRSSSLNIYTLSVSCLGDALKMTLIHISSEENFWCGRNGLMLELPSRRVAGSGVVTLLCAGRWGGAESASDRRLSCGRTGESSLGPAAPNSVDVSTGMPHVSAAITRGNRASRSISHSGLVQIVRSSLSVHW